jgi:plasmid stabilization system protein ParE
VSRVELARGVADDLERILGHLLTENDEADGAGRVREIIGALDVLEANPLIGRPARGRTRELVIGRGSRGYVALYRFVPEADTVFVLAVRGQREVGFRRR